MIARIVGSVLFVSFLSSCPSASSSGSQNPITDTGAEVLAKEKKEASCKYSFTEGQSTPSVLPEKKIKTSLFAKEFDSALLKSVLRSSGAETVRFAEMTHVKYYKIANTDVSSLGCLFNNSIPDAPRVLADELRKYQGSMDKEGDGKSTIEGLYLDKEAVQEITGSSQSVASILLKTDTPRYNMVHEFMHHLFNIQAAKSGTQIKKEVNAAFAEFNELEKTFKAQKTSENLKSLTIKFEGVSDKLIVLLKEFYLEEVTIETELNSEYQMGNFKYVADYNRLNGDFYIVSSAQKATEFLNMISKQSDALSTEKNMLDIQSLSFDDKNEISQKLKAVNDRIRTLKNEVSSHESIAMSRLKAKLRERGLVMGSSFSRIVADESEAVGCSHSHEADEILNSLKNRLNINH